MPTKRRRAERTVRTRVTAKAIAAYRAGDAVQLHRELRLPPWQASPLRAIGDCPHPKATAAAQLWPDSVALREELENAD